MSNSMLALSLCLFAAVSMTSVRAEEEKPKEGGERVFELRTYTAPPGKLANLLTRFRDHTNTLFTKHGMTMIGYWTPSTGPTADNTLIYLLAFPSKEAQEKAWKDFRADPDWIQAKKESEVNGPLTEKVESVLLKPTDFSPMK